MYTLRIVTYERKTELDKYVPNSENFELGTNYSIYRNGSIGFEDQTEDMDKEYKKKLKAILTSKEGPTFIIPYPEEEENRRSYFIVGDKGQTIEKI